MRASSPAPSCMGPPSSARTPSSPRRRATLIRSRPEGNRMAKGYWIARVDVADADVYRRYIAANAEALRKYGARFLVRGGSAECAEGTSRQRNVVLEFPTYDAAV